MRVGKKIKIWFLKFHITLNARILPDTLARIDKNRGKLSRGKYIDSIVPKN